MLGIILAPAGKVPGGFPYEIAQSRGARQDYLGPEDPQWHHKGEDGYYYDTMLGAPRMGLFKRLTAKLGLGTIPTDFEMARGQGMPYTPVNNGWIAAKEGYFMPTYIPPYGRPSGGLPIPVETPGFSGFSLRGLRETAPVPPPASVEDVLAVMNAHNDRIFALSLVSTTAVAVSALLTVFRTLKLIREDAK